MLTDHERQPDVSPASGMGMRVPRANPVRVVMAIRVRQ
jgi:hypothetical protein